MITAQEARNLMQPVEKVASSDLAKIEHLIKQKCFEHAKVARYAIHNDAIRDYVEKILILKGFTVTRDRGSYELVITW